jgi:hypothetical protein
MATKTTSMSFSDLLKKTTIISNNIKLNSEKIARYGLNLPAFTTEMDADITRVDTLDEEQERLKGELKLKTEELNVLKERLTENYALAKKTVKMAEPQSNWIAYGIEDKR